jgi:hypothetical protein
VRHPRAEHHRRAVHHPQAEHRPDLAQGSVRGPRTDLKRS